MKFMLIGLNVGKKKGKGKLRTKKGEEGKNTEDFHQRRGHVHLCGLGYIQEGYPKWCRAACKKYVT